MYFMPKLPHRVDIARETCATMARAIITGQKSPEPRKSAIATLRAVHPAAILTLTEEYEYEVERKQPMRVIQTLEEAITYARENPAR